MRYGYANWSLLAKHSNRAVQPTNPFGDANISPNAAIKIVMETEPYLTVFGYGVFWDPRMTPHERRAKFQENRNDMLSDSRAREFERGCYWLNLVERTKNPNPRAGSSYGLKHRVEQYWSRHFPNENSYITNGMFIAAALHLGFKVKRITDTPNALINIAKRGMPVDEHGVR